MQFLRQKRNVRERKATEYILADPANTWTLTTMPIIDSFFGKGEAHYLPTSSCEC